MNWYIILFFNLYFDKIYNHKYHSTIFFSFRMLPLHTDSTSWEKSTQRNSTAGKATNDGFLIMIAMDNYVIAEDHCVH